MNWKFWKRKKTRVTDADRARLKAEDGLTEANERWPEVHRVSMSLRELREHNHFADAIEATFRGGR